MLRFVKQLYQMILFIIWIFILSSFLFVSTFTFFLFLFCLTLFLFWFILTIIGWIIGFIPILKCVYIPFYRQQIYRTVAFYHPYGDEKNDDERVLWSTVEIILKNYENKNIQIIIYTGHIEKSSNEILLYIKENFNIYIEKYQSSIKFIPLRSEYFIEKYCKKYFPLLGLNICSIFIGIEALIRFIPDLFIDTMDHPYLYPIFHYLASIPILSYVNYPKISTDIYEQTNKRYITYNNYRLITDSIFRSKIQLIYYQILTQIYGWCGRCSNIVFCNSSWTKKYIDLIWKSDCVHLAYPPCPIKEFSNIPFDKNEKKIIVSCSTFHLENNHHLQIEIVHQFLKKKPEYDDQLKLIIISNNDEASIEKLKNLAENLNVHKQIEFRTNIRFKELQNLFEQSIIGLHTTYNEHFGIALIEMMAAGVIVIAHRSGAPKLDIIDDGQTGFLVTDIDGYVKRIEDIFEMSDDDRRRIQEQARNTIDHFDVTNFENIFLEQFQKILYLKKNE